MLSNSFMFENTHYTFWTTILMVLASTFWAFGQELPEIKEKEGTPSIEKDNLDLYLLIGQSNMAGRGSLDMVEAGTDSRILMLDSTNQWVSAKDPLHFDKPVAGVGPGISLAQSMLEEEPNQKIGLIPCAWGGSSIKVWQPGAKYFDNFPYDEAIERAQIAMERGTLKGILWHQGESDNDPEKAAVYLENLKTLVKNLRKDLNAPDLPFVVGEIGYFNKKDHINPVIQQVPDVIPLTAVVSAAGLMDKGDHLHFDTPSARELGRRYAAAIKRLQIKIETRPTMELTFDDAEISHYTQVAPLLKKHRDKATKEKALTLRAEHQRPVIGPDHPDVLASGNRSGFETGQVVKLDGTYHMFVNEMFERPHRDMRIAYWTSNDAANWKRQSSIVESIPGRSPTNPRSEVWVTGVEFNEDENAWNIFYVAYRGGDETKGELAGYDYEGKIWRAKSVIPGKEGIAGPYADMGIILQPDENSQDWEGEQAVATFNPYKAGNTWYAFYDGHQHTPRGPWPTGLAFAPKLSGPWVRMPEGYNPVPIVKEFMENPQVTELRAGGYLTVFDSFGDQEIGYSLSEDGIHWSKETRLKVQTEDNIWAEPGDHAMRTPLCAIEEDDGSFTVIYTAMTMVDGQTFYALGKCVLGWE